MSAAITMGRPLKYGERLAPRQFRLPISLGEKLNKRAIAERRDVSEIVIAALEKELGEERESPASLDEIRQAVHDAMRSDGVVLDLSTKERDQLEAVGNAFSYASLSQFAEDFLRSIFKHTKQETEEYFRGDLQREAAARIKAKQQKPAPGRKAA